MFAKTQLKIHEITFYRDINKKINELLESLSKLEVNATDKITPRTKQNLFKNDIKKVFDTLFFYTENLHVRYREKNICFLNDTDSHAFSLEFQILQFQSEIQDLRKYNDVATIPLKN